MKVAQKSIQTTSEGSEVYKVILTSEGSQKVILTSEGSHTKSF